MSRPLRTSPVTRTKLILAFLALVAVYHIAGAIWGRDSKLYFAGALVIIYVIVAIAARVAERRLATRFSHLDAEQRATLSASDPDFDSVLRPAQQPPWYWRALGGLFGVALALGSPILVSLVRGDSLSSDSIFTGYHLLAMACGVGIYYLLHARFQSWLNSRYASTNVA